MKRFLMITVSALALSAGAAMAGGNDNASSIEQIGDSNNAYVTQTGGFMSFNSNTSGISQVGVGNTASVTQQGQDNVSISSVAQNGGTWGNSASITQQGNSNDNTSSVLQTGYGYNTVNVNQSGNFNTNTSGIVQSGAFNGASVNQN